MFSLSRLPVSHLLGPLEQTGAVSLPLLDDDFRRLLFAEARKAAFRAARESIGKGDRIVYQRMEVCDQFEGLPSFLSLRDGFQALWDASFANLEPYPFESAVIFNDLMLQRYTEGEVGITPHRDRTGYRNIICLFVVEGYGKFFVCGDRSGTGAVEIPNAPGDLVLTRAPGFLQSSGRPFHFVRDIRSSRYVFGLRQEVS